MKKVYLEKIAEFVEEFCNCHVLIDEHDVELKQACNDLLQAACDKDILSFIKNLHSTYAMFTEEYLCSKDYSVIEDLLCKYCNEDIFNIINDIEDIQYLHIDLE